MVHNVPSPEDSTSWAIIVSTSSKGAPARISRRVLSTDSEESKPDAFCASFVLETSFERDCVTDSISSHFSTLLREESVGLNCSPRLTQHLSVRTEMGMGARFLLMLRHPPR